MQQKKSPQNKTPLAQDVSTVLKGAAQITAVGAREIFHGPLPPPDSLKQYEQILPGIAERIVAMAEQEQKTRLELMRSEAKQKETLLEITNRESQAATKAVVRGQWLGFSVVVVCVACATVCAFCGMDWWIVCSFLGLLTASLLSVFIPRQSKKADK